jgi:tRNA/tmRNA/rRNA uracil-C5-methylase (TrmA/RlmC/RlmD family)
VTVAVHRPAGPLLGQQIEVEVGPVAHGGHCVARHHGRVVFVRHALPGERVVARVTEDGGGAYCRADAVQVLRAAPDRVPAPCPHAGPGRCGGCDWQHVTGEAQRRLKAAVVREQLERLAGLSDVDVVVAALPGGRHGGLLGWRTRVRFAITPDGRTGLHRHRSHAVQPIGHCPLATEEVDAAGVGQRQWPGAAAVEVVASTGGDRTVVVTPASSRRARPARTGPAVVTEWAAGRTWRVAATGFWQVHPAAADTLAGCVRELLAPRPGEEALDLYAGAGLFAGVLAGAVGERGRVVAVESDRVAARDATANLADLPQARVLRTRVTAGLLGRLDVRPDVAVLDPPRAGAGSAVVATLLSLHPRAVAYVACDPAALGRDVRAARAAGYRLATLRAFDLFPMTHHVECVALLTPEGRRSGC